MTAANKKLRDFWFFKLQHHLLPHASVDLRNWRLWIDQCPSLSFCHEIWFVALFQSQGSAILGIASREFSSICCSPPNFSGNGRQQLSENSWQLITVANTEYRITVEMNTDKFPFSARSHYAKQNSSRHAAQFCLVKCLRIIHESKVGRMTLQLFNEIWWELSDPPIHPKIGWSWWSDNANFLDFQQISGWEGKTFPTCSETALPNGCAPPMKWVFSEWSQIDFWVIPECSQSVPRVYSKLHWVALILL